MTDKELQQAVQEELAWEPRVNEAHIGVTAKDGVVTLTGLVSSFAEKQAAEQVAQRVRGVRAIAEEITVRLPEAHKVADEEIAGRAIKILDWDVEVPHDRIHVKVELGIATLSGDVDWSFQRQAAERDVQMLSGVIAVFNNIAVKSEIGPTNIGEAISLALRRRADLDASAIDVAVDGGIISLNGSVKSWFERDIAETVARTAPGVVRVSNHIVIQP